MDNAIPQLELVRDKIVQEFSCKGFAHLSGSSNNIMALQASDADDLVNFLESWSNLPLDRYMADGGRYRKRRHSVYIWSSVTDSCRKHGDMPHYQSLRFNSLNGGVARHFLPIEQPVILGQTMQSILRTSKDIVRDLLRSRNDVANHGSSWLVELHQFRIEAKDGQIGNPTPEGRHRDGVNYVFIIFIGRANVNGGQTVLVDEGGTILKTLTLADRFETLVLDDERVYHEVSPLTHAGGDGAAYRDALVITYKVRSSERASLH